MALVDLVDLDEVRREAAPEVHLAQLRLGHLVPDQAPGKVLSVRQEARANALVILLALVPVDGTPSRRHHLWRLSRGSPGALFFFGRGHGGAPPSGPPFAAESCKPNGRLPGSSPGISGF